MYFSLCIICVGSCTWNDRSRKSPDNFQHPSYIPPALDCGGLENKDSSPFCMSAGPAGDDGNGARSPPGELSTRRPLAGGDVVSSDLDSLAFLALLLAAEMQNFMLTLVLLIPDIPCFCKRCRSRSVGF